MAEITAQAVNEFRKRTGLGLMECKTLLKEADGDLKKAETLAKERGLKNAEKRAGRAAKAGRLEVALSPDAKSGALVELNCETDFVARNDEFRQTARELAEQVLANGDSGLLDQKSHKTPEKTVREVLIDLNARTGENVSLARGVRFQVAGSGRVDSYIHHDGKQGALIQVNTADDATADSEGVRQLLKDLAMQAVAAKPVAVHREEIPAETTAEQKRIFLTQVPEDKPENIRDKIATGKLEAWYGDVSLVDQPLVKDPSKKVRDAVSASGKGVSVARMALFIVGEGAEG
jgi:elongation factor Ts